MSVVIGPPATRLLFENDDVKIWMMDVAPGETYPHHYHHYDYVLFYTTDVLATVHDDAPEEHTSVWNERFGKDDAAPAGIWTYAHSVFYIPGTGFLSPGFVNIGNTAMVSPLIEVKRARRDDQEHIGFARSDGLVGFTPNGTAHLLENDRLKVAYTAMAPGATASLGPHRGSAVCVIDGGNLAIDGAAASSQLDSPSQSAYWRDPTVRQLTNVGTTLYREISVELK